MRFSTRQHYKAFSSVSESVSSASGFFRLGNGVGFEQIQAVLQDEISRCDDVLLKCDDSTSASAKKINWVSAVSFRTQ